MARVAASNRQRPSERPSQAPADVAAQIRHALRDGGSAEHATGVQWFFKDEIKSHGWYTAALRRVAVRLRREVRKEHGLDFLVEVANHLFSGSVLEEKIAAVFLLEKLDAEFGDREFPMGEVNEPPAPKSRVRGDDSRGAREDVLPGDREALELASRGQR
jgi:hypothetical protein